LLDEGDGKACHGIGRGGQPSTHVADERTQRTKEFKSHQWIAIRPQRRSFNEIGKKTRPEAATSGSGLRLCPPAIAAGPDKFVQFVRSSVIQSGERVIGLCHRAVGGQM
jgi:hypothetical protein